MRKQSFLLGVIGLCLVGPAVGKPLRVYILAGQSNMQGSAHQSTFGVLREAPGTAGLASEFLEKDGSPVVADDAWITYLTDRGQQEAILKGEVKVGYGFDDERIGPEYGFGIHLDRQLEGPVLIIKTAWGGKSLAVDFRPSSAGPYPPSDAEKESGKLPGPDEVGHYYRKMMGFVKATLKDAESIREVVPDYDPDEGYELSGFVWFQGWNDLCNRHYTGEYTANMIHFIEDVRRDLKAPALPFVVGVLGVYGTEPDTRRFDKGLPVGDFRKQQFEAVAQYDRKAAAEFRGRVVAVDSGPFYDLELSDIYWKRRLTGHWKQQVKKGEMTREAYLEQCAQYDFGDGELTASESEAWEKGASNAEYHYLGSGKTFIGFGKALAEAILKFEEREN